MPLRCHTVLHKEHLQVGGTTHIGSLQQYLAPRRGDAGGCTKSSRHHTHMHATPQLPAPTRAWWAAG